MKNPSLAELSADLDLNFVVDVADFNNTLNNIRPLNAAELDTFVYYITHTETEPNPEAEKARTLMFGQLFTALASFIGVLKPHYNQGAEPPLDELATIGGMMHIIVQCAREWFPENDERSEWSFGEILRILIDNGALDDPALTFLDFVKLARREGQTLTFSDLIEWVKTSPDAKRISKKTAPLAKHLKQPTFIEARATATALCDGPDLRNWKPIVGALALLHNREGSKHQIRFEPSSILLGRWNNGNDSVAIANLEDELCSLELDAIITFFICLSSAIENPELDTSIDNIITAIGRDKDARRTAETRALWRGKVWRWILLFDSLQVIGARNGTWREPKNNNEKRPRMEAQQLHSTDALLKIIGQRGVEQGTLDNSAVPKEVTLVLGPWARAFRGNREILSDFGTLRAIATIPRGKPSGAWAACAGLMLQQRWRENATYAPVARTGEDNKQITQQFRPFTRKELLLDTWRSGDDLQKILDGPDPGRAKTYWNQAVGILKEHGVIGHYKELKPLRKGREWQDEWLKQPLDIRPSGENRSDAAEIHASAQAAKKRGRKLKAA